MFAQGQVCIPPPEQKASVGDDLLAHCADWNACRNTRDGPLKRLSSILVFSINIVLPLAAKGHPLNSNIDMLWKL